MTRPVIKDGIVEVPGGKVWYQMVGAGDKTPLVTLHGGPGFPHNSLAPFFDLADDRPVLFYDQLGCGKSDRPSDPNLWKISRFIDELAAVREILALEKINILGHSWGTMLAVDYYLAHPEGIGKLVLASPALSVSRWQQDGQKHIQALERQHQEAISKHDAGEKYDEEAFNRAEAEYSRRHFCRLDSWPEDMKQAGAGFGAEVYNAMWGHCEWRASGTLESYERVDRLSEIEIPVMLTCGRFDEATPDATAFYASHIPHAELSIFENSAHVAHFEDRADYIRTIREFLDSG